MRRLLLLSLGLALFSEGAMAQQSSPGRARYYYGGEAHIGPATIGTMYDGSGHVMGRSFTDSQGSTTIYGNDGKVVGRTSTDGQGTTTFYSPDGRVTGTAVPDGGR